MHIRDMPAAARRLATAWPLQPQAILRWRPDRFTLTLATLALLGAALILARQVNYGVGIDLDSTIYISVARHLLEGEGFVELTNKEPFVKWPPLYPLLLAAASLFVFDPLDVAGPLNAAIFGLTIFVAGHYLRQRIHSRFLILWACLAILLSIPLTSIAYTAMSEPLFILFVTLSLLHTDNFLRQGQRAFLLGATMFTTLACLTRYIGLTLPITIFLLLRLQHNTGSVTKIKHSTAYALISTSPLFLWILRNILVDGKPTGQIDWDQIHSLTKSLWNFLGLGQPSGPNSGTNPLLEILHVRLNDLASWMFFDLPLGEFRSIVVALTGITLLALAIALGVLLRTQQKTAAWIGWSPFCVFSAFALVYLISLLMAGVTTYVDIHRRHLSPMYIPLLFTAVFVMDRFLRAERQRKLLGTLGDLPFIGTIVQGGVKQVSLLTVLLSAALSLWLGWSVPINAHAIRQANEQISPSTAITRYADSAVLQYMREHSIDDVIMTNLWKGHMYFYTNATAYHLLPTLSHWHKYKVNRFIGNAEDDVYLVWFYCVKMPCGDVWFYGPHTPNLDVFPELEPVAELEDGVIFKVNKAYGNAEAYRAITANQPTVRSNFDLYLNDNSLHYVRDTCRPDDIQARFFLHIIPHDTNDLPQHRQQYGFDNLNFDFYEHGVRFDGKCLASILLPDYPIASINTGQWIPFRQWIRSGQWRRGERQLWQGEFPFHEE